MITNRMQITRLKEKIANYKKIVLYGAGEMAACLVGKLNENAVNVEFCIVTSKKNKTILDRNSIEIKSLSECKEILDDKQTIIIIAVTAKYEKEIASILKDNGLKNYIFITEYLWWPLDRETYNDIYQGCGHEWYRNRMDEWKQDYGDETNEYMLPLFRNSIAIIANNPSPRICKILSALKKRNERVIVFIDINVSTEKSYQPFLALIQKNCNACICFYCIEELMTLLVNCKPRVVHIFSHPWSPYLAFELIRMKDEIGKIVFENYDIANGMYTIFDQKSLDMERFCLENADGVICRGFETEYLVKQLGFKLQKTLTFFDYCGESIKKKKKMKMIFHCAMQEELLQKKIIKGVLMHVC